MVHLTDPKRSLHRVVPPLATYCVRYNLRFPNLALGVIIRVHLSRCYCPHWLRGSSFSLSLTTYAPAVCRHGDGLQRRFLRSSFVLFRSQPCLCSAPCRPYCQPGRWLTLCTSRLPYPRGFPEFFPHVYLIGRAVIKIGVYTWLNADGLIWRQNGDAFSNCNAINCRLV